MGDYKARRGFLQGWQINVAEMMFRGLSDEEICIEQFRTPKDDKRKMNNAKAKLRNLRKSVEFQEYYKTLIQEWTVHHVGRALSKLSSQIDDKNGWLANKACNDILNQSKSFTGSDDNSIVVKIEGGIDLGTPEE